MADTRAITDISHIDFFFTGTLSILPYFLGFIAASFNELCIWVALKRAIPPLNESFGVARESRGKWHTVVAVVVLVSLCIVELSWVVKSPLRDPLQRFGLMVVYVGLFFVTAKFASWICGVRQIVVHRTPGGKYIKRPYESSSNRRHTGVRLLIIASAFLVILSLMATEDMISVNIVTMAIVHLVSRSTFGRYSFSKMIKCYVSLLITIVAIILLQRLVSQDVGKTDENVLQISLSSDVWSRIHFIPATLCSTFIGGLIVRMLRFDYQRHLDGPECGQELDLTTVPAPTANSIFYKKEDLVDGVLVPQRAPRAFLKPYFTTALVTWTLVHITFIGFGLHLTKVYDASAIALLLEFPITLIVLLLFAAFKKETNLLWSYQESWELPQAEGAISLPTSSDVIGRE